jgi:hypothetical protein
VALEFTPPYAGPPIRVRGTVRNRAGYRYGVEFLIENAGVRTGEPATAHAASPESSLSERRDSPQHLL